jgi:hypothetical protein
MLIGYAPGNPPVVLRVGDAILFPKGWKILFELHYTPNGRVQTDISRIGLRFAKKEDVRRLVHGAAVANSEFREQKTDTENTVFETLASDKIIKLINC